MRSKPGRTQAVEPRKIPVQSLNSSDRYPLSRNLTGPARRNQARLPSEQTRKLASMHTRRRPRIQKPSLGEAIRARGTRRLVSGNASMTRLREGGASQVLETTAERPPSLPHPARLLQIPERNVSAHRQTPPLSSSRGSNPVPICHRRRAPWEAR